MTDLDVRMTIKTLASKGVAKRAIARQLGLSEGTVRYLLRRQAAGANDGRAKQRFLAADYAAAIERWRDGLGASAVNLAELHGWLSDRFTVQWVAAFAWNQWPICREIRSNQKKTSAAMYIGANTRNAMTQ